MPEEVKNTPDVDAEPSTVEKLRDDMRKEFNEFKIAVQKEMEQKDAQIKELTAANDQLRASLVRNTFIEPPPEKKEPTPEELYKAEVQKYADKVIKRMKQELTG